MATYNVTGPGGTAGHPSKLSAGIRTPYLVENTIDVSAINGDSGAAQNDVLRVLDIPAETLVMEAGIEVLTALSSSVTLDLVSQVETLIDMLTEILTLQVSLHRQLQLEL